MNEFMVKKYSDYECYVIWINNENDTWNILAYY